MVLEVGMYYYLNQSVAGFSAGHVLLFGSAGR